MCCPIVGLFFPSEETAIGTQLFFVSLLKDEFELLNSEYSIVTALDHHLQPMTHKSTPIIQSFAVIGLSLTEKGDVHG